MTNQSFPNHPDKHRGEALVRPEHFLSRVLRRDDLRVPEAIIMGYSGRLTSMLVERGFTRDASYPTSWRALWVKEGASVGVVEGFGYGAPAAAIVMEELATLGARRFISLGMAGALASEVGFGDVVVCTGAVRDEGVSHHYLAAARYAYPTDGLTNEVCDALAHANVPFTEGATWTIDAIYRETLEEALAYRDEGVVTVDMEAAALFAIAQVRGVEVASLFSVSDHLLSGETWELAPDSAAVVAGLAVILDAALSVLNSEDEGAPSLATDEGRFDANDVSP